MAKLKKKQQAVFQDEFLLKTFFANIPFGVVIVNSGGMVVYVNTEGSRIVDIPKDILLQQQFEIIQLNNGKSGKLEPLPFVLLRSGGHSFIKSSHHKMVDNVKKIPVDLFSFARNDIEGNMQFAIFVLQQSSDGAVIRQPLHSPEIVEKFFNIISDAAFILDRSGQLIEKNTAADHYITKVMGATSFSLELLHQDVQAILSRLGVKKENLTIELTQKGKVFEQTYYALIEADGSVNRFLVVVRDVSVLKGTEKELFNFSNYNQLTKLPNRYLFKQSLEKSLTEITTEQNIVVLNVNIDKFTMINELLGYDRSGAILTETAKLLESSFGDKGVVGHQGGDEFFVFVKVNLSKINPDKMARQLLTSLSKKLTKIDQCLFITACIGVSVSGEDGDSAELLIQNSHSALSVAKSQRPNTVISYSHKFTKNALSESKMVHRIYSGLLNDEFFLLYQPKINAYDGTVIGIEALLRWKTANGRVLTPNKFIPVAEKNGLMVALGNFAMEKMLIQMREWTLEGKRLVPISMNLSNSQQDIFEQLKHFTSLIKKYKVDPGLVEIEITEKVLSQNILKCKDVLSKFKEVGVLTAIDDFGTVFSSIAYLQELEVDRLILDRSIVGKIQVGSEFNLAAKTIINLAHTFNFSVIAEGAETLEQVQFLLDSGCPHIQGNYFSEPVSAEKMVELMRIGVKAV